MISEYKESSPKNNVQKYCKLKPWITNNLCGCINKHEILHNKIKAQPHNVRLQRYYNSYSESIKKEVKSLKRIIINLSFSNLVATQKNNSKLLVEINLLNRLKKSFIITMKS